MKATLKLCFLLAFLVMTACSRNSMISQTLGERQDFITNKILEPQRMPPRTLTTFNPTINEVIKKEEKEEEKLVMFEEIEAKIVFNSGEYAPNKQGTENIDFVFQELKHDLLDYKKQFPNDTIILEVLVMGYSDNAPFYEGQTTTERKEMNKKMSYKRAKNVGDFLKNHLETYVDKVDEVLVAKGEDLPPGIQVGMMRDARRRICLVDLRVYAKK